MIRNAIKLSTLLLIVFILLSQKTWSQISLMQFLEQVENNNKSIKAANEYALVKQLTAKTNINPENPEFEFGYFPGNTNEIGTKQVIGVSQTLEFPSTYIYKNRISEDAASLAMLDFKLFKQEV